MLLAALRVMTTCPSTCRPLRPNACTALETFSHYASRSASVGISPGFASGTGLPSAESFFGAHGT